MTEQDSTQLTGWDRVVRRLQDARHTAGDPSYADIAQRVVRLRVDRGESEDAARLARSTVYDCFRTGRARLNVPLVRDIGETLDVPPAEIDRWVAERDLPIDPPPAPEPPVVEEPAPAGEPAPVPVVPPVTAALAALIMVGSVLLNLAGVQLQVALGLPVHLDMVGTAVAAIALGPWRGAAVGVATNALAVAFFGWVSLPFALVNVVGALLWGYGVRRWGLGRTLPRFLGLNVLAGVGCSLVALVLIAVVFGPEPAASGSELLGGLLVGTPAWVALVVSNLVTSVGDKVLSGFVALAVVGLLPVAVRAGLGSRLVGTSPAEPQRVG
ncbi:hypothetical protein [uncultured Nocardioides sp.]|uniref:hypothetical protein n=1 Tax=uncultured Nocardioides sp. TaxID=198441 RepID=UPI002614A026|nr:hypothetical protein [uncultured Nocardioides sp.]